MSVTMARPVCVDVEIEDDGVRTHWVAASWIDQSLVLPVTEDGSATVDALIQEEPTSQGSTYRATLVYSRHGRPVLRPTLWVKAGQPSSVEVRRPAAGDYRIAMEITPGHSAAGGCVDLAVR